MEIGISTAIGAATCGVMKGSEFIKTVATDSAFQVFIRGAIEGAIIQTTSELVRLGLDPEKENFDWIEILKAAGIGGLMRYVCWNSANRGRDLG